MISKKSMNAIDLCVMLAGSRGECYLSTTDLSSRLDLSISYLEIILKALKDHGIVMAMKGPGGGYKVKGDASLISAWDIARVFEKTLADAEQISNAETHGSYELELEQVVMRTLKSFMISDFAAVSAHEATSYADAMGRFKFKPLPVPFMPKAPNSVFQLHASI